MSLGLKPTHSAVKNYYAALNQLGQLHFDNEAQVSDAFAKLLTDCGRKLHLTFIPQFPIQRAKTRVIVDGALLDTFHLAHGYWEAKDEKDDLEREIKAKLDKGYPRDNIIFQAPERAVLYQAGARIADQNITKPDYLTQIVNQFFDYKADYIQEWEQAVSEFSDRIQELSKIVENIIHEERQKNRAFATSFESFYVLCQQAINPNLTDKAIERMLVQHLLTERIFRKIFKNPDFTRRNIIAQEIEKVIGALTSRSFNRDEFLAKLDRFYKAIEVSAENTTDFTEKQHFLNKVYERFFQGYSPKEADTHGIVYTPQPIVNFMVRSVEEILQKEFGRSLGDKDVHILDPFVGTGNFIVNIMEKIKATDLAYKYENELHCNEIMLLPYYIASMNIEHAYFDRVGEYKAFPGICLVDTFELAEAEQASLGFMTAENAERVKRQKESPIFVIIGNPPYNAWQVNENDNNRKRKYEHVDERVNRTYSRSSKASNTSALSDVYVKAIRWATDRIGREGLIVFVTNNNFVDESAFDGMRKCLEDDFQRIYILDLGGNVRKNPKLSGTTHNVFGIQVGVSINFFVRSEHMHQSEIRYFSLEKYLRKEQRYDQLNHWSSVSGVSWRTVIPDRSHRWLSEGAANDFDAYCRLSVRKGEDSAPSIFSTYSIGVTTNRDAWVYNQDAEIVRLNVQNLIQTYNTELARWNSSEHRESIDDFLLSDDKRIKWSSRLKECLLSGKRASWRPDNVRWALYRPFCRQYLYFDEILTHRRGLFTEIFPVVATEHENLVMAIPGVGNRQAFGVLASQYITSHDLAFEKTQCFPFYTYAEDGTHRRENITDWALEQFRDRYGDRSITKWDIFHYIYAVLHHPEYRERYAANLRRELPRVPYATLTTCHPEAAESGAKRATPHEGPMHSGGVRGAANESIGPSDRKERGPQDDNDLFRVLAAAGQRLAEIHVHYEQQTEHPLKKVEKAGEKLDWRVAKMRLSKDKTTLTYNQFLTLSGIPPEVYEYRLGNRSALEWVIDQYQVSTDKRSGIVNDPNRADDPQYILRLIGQVITVSLETVQIVRSLPSLGIEAVETITN
jgi:predicted helicase